MKKLNAFTLAEVVVVLIISMILLSTIFTVLYIINRQNISFNKNVLNTNEFLLAEKIIRDDMYAADSVKKIQQGNMLRCYVNSDSISYYFGPDFLERTAPGNIDSFKISIGIFSEKYVDGTDLIKQINLQKSNKADSIVLCIQKYYDAVSVWQSTKSDHERN